MLSNNCRRSGTCAMPARTMDGVGQCAMVRSSKRMSPAETATSPMTVLSNVLLPAPLAPIRATISPVPTLSETSCSAGSGPYPLDTQSSSSSTRGNFLAKIGSDHTRISADRVGQAFRDHLPMIHHHDVVGQSHHQSHVVLDHQHRHAE